MDKVDLHNCHQEPIATPGSIQPFGALLVLAPTDHTIRMASANAGNLLPGAPDAATLLDRPLTEWLPCAAALEEMERTLEQRPKAVRLLPALPEGEPTALHLTAHHSGDGLVVELERVTDPATEGGAGTMEELDHFLHRFTGWKDPDALLAFAAGELRQVAGAERAMVYRFDADYNGTIAAEFTDGRPRRYEGQRFPASDIPQQARALYRRNRVRTIPDTAYAPVPLLARDRDVEAADLGMALLRSVSPIHLEYLNNLGVRATLAISILDEEDDLWGMLVCHDGEPRTFPPAVRAYSARLGELLSAHIPLLRLRLEEEATDRGLDRINELFADLPRADDLVTYLEQRAPELLTAFEAEGMMVCLRGECYTMGKAPPSGLQEVLEATVTEAGTHDEILAAKSLGRQREDGTSSGWVAGALYVPLANHGNDYLCLFRQEQIETIDWAGNPNKAIERNPDTGRLSPRKSFELWREEVRGQSLPWQEHHIKMAEKLSQLVGLHQGYKVRQALEIGARLQHQAHHDALTGLPNRTLLLDRLQQAMERVDRHGHSLGLLFTDLDGFKAINDSLGHATGDRVLMEIANRLATELRDCDTVARLGGDEFVILAETGSPDEARDALGAIAQRIIDTVAHPMESESGQPRLGTSIGIACHVAPETGSARATPEQLLRQADAAMYEAKRTGRNRYTFAREE